MRARRIFIMIVLCNNSEPVRRTFILIPIAEHGCEAALCIDRMSLPERIESKKTSFERKVLSRHCALLYIPIRSRKSLSRAMQKSLRYSSDTRPLIGTTAESYALR